MIFNVNSGAGKQPVNVVPSTNSSFTYDGSAKAPLWQNFDSEQLTISGADSATNAGTYTVYFTPKADYEWWDGTSTPKEVKWSIAKAAGSLSLSATSATVTGKNSGAKTFTVTRAGDGKISVTSSNTAYATASVSGTTVTVTPKGYGTATITVSVAAGTNHTAPSSKTYTITINVLYLYNAGNENTSVTGGWTTAPKNLASWGYAAGTPYISKGSTSMTFGAKVASEGAICYAKNKINLAGYTTLKYEGTLQSSDDIWLSHGLIVWTSLGTYYTDNIAASVELEGSGSTKSINVSSLNSSYYIGFGAYISTFTIKKLWLE